MERVRPWRSGLKPFGLDSVRRVRELEGPRSRLWRAELHGTPVMVKQLVDAPEAADRYAREVTSLRLAATVNPPVVPRLLDTDPDERVLVLEYVEHRHPGPDWRVDYAAALARLHAAGHTAADTETRALPVWSGPTGDDIEALLRLAAALGVPEPPGVGAELEGLVARLARTTNRALLHGDPCPGNDLHTADGVRFIDFEQASLGDGLVELAYLRIGFPTCWCSTSPAPEQLAEAEAAYRAAWREATGTEVRGDVTDACAGWMLRGDALVPRAERGTVDHLARVPDADWEWGTATARQRLTHRLGVVADRSGELPALGRLAVDLRTSMLTRWPKLRPLPWERPHGS
ncbi:phosphotransferase [Streptomyces endophyticus]|uniref:Phosphotransferase n=1 Tax=Streptomyces endophyticus TaxID=714166 RepID=A0ABU6FJQ3_9ACTN|nr:phosphotransferase [Streptomyces endophyticus]MEB8343081.1 phosphotransferase [Streptomyces endophyticus]